MAQSIPDVLFMSDETGGCAWYRCQLPARALAAAGVAVASTTALRVRTRPVAGSLTAITEVLDLGRVTVIQRPIRHQLRALIERAADQGARIIVDLDDDFWSLTPDNPATRHILATGGLTHLVHACRAASAVIVSTPALARRVSRETGQRNIAVIPNAIDPALFPPCPIPPDGLIRVGWAGGSSHRNDLRLIAPALSRLTRDPRVQCHTFGVDLLPPDVPHLHHQWADAIPEHYRRIGILDVAAAPLTTERFNRSKSNVKWLEHAAHGTPMVLSPLLPYTESARDNDTALFADTPRDWYRQLHRLVADPILRWDIGQSAYQTVMAQHTIARRLPLYREVLAA